jgi:hypothetical protein
MLDMPRLPAGRASNASAPIFFVIAELPLFLRVLRSEKVAAQDTSNHVEEMTPSRND